MREPSVDFKALNIDPDEILAQGRAGLLIEASKLGLGDELTDRACPIYGDTPPGMTTSRLLARFLSRFAWYHPRRSGGDDGGPNLDAAWAHYEHWTLARYYTDGNCCGTMDRAEAGDSSRPTSLYPVWGTPLSELADFGISLRIYFHSILVLSVLLLAVGALNLPMLRYFWTYGKKDGIPATILGSAICDSVEWVECETCNENPEYYPAYRLDGQNALMNVCDFEDWLVPGLLSYGSTIVLLLFWAWFYVWQKRVEVAFDEEIQTSSDYSIKIRNPPPDATDPEEWRRFFSRFADRNGGVVVCTIALDNAELVGALIRRRRLVKKLSESLPVGVDVTDESAVADAVADCPGRGYFGLQILSTNAQKQYSKVKDMEEKIRELGKRDYRAVAVFVTFETERGQRNALHALTTGTMDIWRNKLDTYKLSGNTMKVHEKSENTSDAFQPYSCMDKDEDIASYRIDLAMSKDSSGEMGERLLFRGSRVLGVKEAAESNDVRWQDLQVHNRVRVVQFVGTTITVIAFMTWSGFFIYGLVKDHSGSSAAPIFIAVTNVIIPKICSFINKF